jgi:hypothetical protein
VKACRRPGQALDWLGLLAVGERSAMIVSSAKGWPYRCQRLAQVGRPATVGRDGMAGLWLIYHRRQVASCRPRGQSCQNQRQVVSGIGKATGVSRLSPTAPAAASGRLRGRWRWRPDGSGGDVSGHASPPAGQEMVVWMIAPSPREGWGGSTLSESSLLIAPAGASAVPPPWCDIHVGGNHPHPSLPLEGGG